MSKKATAEMMKQVASLMQGDRQAFAELITEFIQPNHLTVDIISLLLNSRSLNPGDLLVKKVRKGIRVHSLVPGTVHPFSEVTVSERINYHLTGNHVAVTANKWELDNSHIGTAESILAEMQAQLRDSHLNRVFNALSSIWNSSNTPDNYINASGPISSGILKQAIDHVNQTTGGVRAVFGSRKALTPITTFGAGWDIGNGPTNAWGVDSQLEEVMKTGWLGVYYGAPIIAYNQVYDNPEDYNPLLPSDKILVIGENVGDFITYGQPEVTQWLNPNVTPTQWHIKLWQQIGLLIDRAEGIVVVGNVS